MARIEPFPPSHQPNALNDTPHILAAADRCVMCGLCLPHCPTYRLHHSELESPRGRIALIQALARGELQADAALQRHLDSCLVCRACEKMCPSKVPYGQLIDESRALLRRQGKRAVTAVEQLLQQVTDEKRLQRNISLLRGYQKSGAQAVLRATGLLKLAGVEELESSLPTIPVAAKLADHYPAQGEPRGRVGLLTGCIGSQLEGEVHLAAIELLTRLGFTVEIPTAQGCCGSLHQHNGETKKAAELARHNIELFDGLELDAVISTASGCAAQLAEYPTLYGDSTTPYYEVCDFLAAQEWPATLQLKALPLRARLHQSCSQRNVLQRPDAVAALLARIPQLQCEELAENELCCGAAGSYLLSQRDNANALCERKLDGIEQGSTGLLVSNNLGCALHLRDGLKQRGMAIEVVHPLLLLQRALH